MNGDNPNTIDMPWYLWSIVHSSLDLRIAERMKVHAEYPKVFGNGEDDDVFAMLKNARAIIESKASTGGMKLQRIYTDKKE